MEDNTLHILLQRYREGNLDREGLQQLDRLLDSAAGRQELETLLDEQLAKEVFNKNDFSHLQSKIQSLIAQRIQNEKPVPSIAPVYRLKWLRYAAVILVLAGISVFWLFLQKRHRPLSPAVVTNNRHDVPETGRPNAVMLSLSGGRKLMLDSIAQGRIAGEDGSKVVKLSGDAIAYQADSADAGANAENVLSVPVGRQYALTLSDGSRVWLNAMSTIRFPAVFTKYERIVQITGEAYFEVAKKNGRPFIVRTRAEPITVLGTSFNIRAYDQEPAVKTTLLEGSVRVSNVILKPGQSFINGRVVAANTAHDIAWKNGFFQFDNEKAASILNELARWYGWEVHVEGRPAGISFNGRISRTTTADAMLGILKESGLKYRLQENHLFIIP